MPEIREVRFSPEAVEKLWEDHDLTQWEVEEVVYAEDSDPHWDEDPDHGMRVVIRGELEGDPPRLVFVSLAPVDPEQGIWDCITAFVPTNPAYGAESEGD